MREDGCGDRGSVTAELAVALPALVLVIALGVSALGAGARQVRLQDAVADAARLVSRGDGDRAGGVVSAAVPGAEVQVADDGDTVCVSATAPAGIPFLRLSARSCALGGGG